MKSEVLSLISERPGLTTIELADGLALSEKDLLEFLKSSDNDFAEYANGGWYLRLSARQSTGAAETLERIRRRLLDLSRRNQLLNYKHPKARSIRVVDELPDQLFERLVNDEGFIFESLPRVPIHTEDAPEYIQEYLEEIPDKRRPQRKRWAELHGINPNLELPASDSGADRHKDLKIQKLLFSDELETRVKYMSRLARTAIEESGANILYLAFGFLSWRESEDSEKDNLAPLVLLPVKLTKTDRDPKTRRQQFKLHYSEEDMQSNLSLRERLSRDFDLELPELDDDDTPEKYFDRCKPTLQAQPTWKIHRYVSLGFFQFGKLLMYLDLDRTQWPTGKKIDDHSTIKKILGGEISGAASYAEEYDIDNLSFDLPQALLIEEADSSQHSAIIDAAKGKNLVIEGPPGTGKSQTITNIIAIALAQGKSVLFVAEKLAALEVVKHRLEGAGLGEFCLELHSHKTQKRKFLEDVGKRTIRR